MTTWRTHDGKRVPIAELDDYHVANIIHWMNENRYRYHHTTIEEFAEEAKKRNFMDEFLELAPYPYQNDKGEWVNPKTLEVES